MRTEESEQCPKRKHSKTEMGKRRAPCRSRKTTRAGETSDGVELGAEGDTFCISFEAPSAAVAFRMLLFNTSATASDSGMVKARMSSPSEIRP